MPRRSSRCGSHVHVSPGGRRYYLNELKAVAFAVVWYDNEVQQILTRGRRNAHYCRPNIAHSQMLQGRNMSAIAGIINNVRMRADLVKIIQGWGQDDRRTLWNFQNVTTQHLWGRGSSGTVEFRGGRCLRGPLRTKRWIAFAIAFIILAIREVSYPQLWGGHKSDLQQFPMPLRSSYSRTSIEQFWLRIREAARDQGLEQNLPTTYTIMNETQRLVQCCSENPHEQEADK